MCNFLGSVLPQQRFEMVDQCYSLITAQGFIWQAKESTPFPLHDSGPTPKERAQSRLASAFFRLSPPHLEPALCKLAWPRRGHVSFTWSSHFSMWIFFCSIFMGYFLSLSFSHCHFGLLFPILTTRSNCQHSLGHRKSKRVPEKHLFLLYWLCQSLWLCGSQYTVENSERDGNTRLPDLPLEKPVGRSGSNS